jgi:hypothetical protein
MMHLMRNYLCGPHRKLIAGRLVFHTPFSRNLRTVQVVLFGNQGTGCHNAWREDHIIVSHWVSVGSEGIIILDDFEAITTLPYITACRHAIPIFVLSVRYPVSPGGVSRHYMPQPPIQRAAIKRVIPPCCTER